MLLLKFLDSIFSDVLSFYNVFFLGMLIIPIVVAYAVKQMVVIPIRATIKKEDA